MTPQRFSLAALAPTQWKNGGGMTREIACRPALAGAGDFNWRASVATIAADGPFSTYPGIDRVIVLLDGGGVRLRSADGGIDHRLDAPLAPFAFAGEAAIDATLLAGGSTDFNLMTRRSALRADVRVLRGADTQGACTNGLLLATHGTWRCTAGSAQTLDAGSGLWWDGVPLAWQLEPTSADAALISVQLHPANP